MSAAVKDLQPELKDSKAALLAQSDDGKNGSPGHAASSTITIEDEGGHRRKGSEQGGASIVIVKERVTGALKKSSPARKGLTWTGHFFAVLVPFLSMLIGSLYIDDCPANRMVPIYLIVLGAVTALAHISTAIDIVRGLPYVQHTGEQKPAILTLISTFLLVWVILGCVWTFSLYAPDVDPWIPYYHDRYCHYNLYWFAFAVNIFAIVSWVFGLSICCCVFGVLCHSAMAEKKSRQELPPEVKV